MYQQKETNNNLKLNIMKTFFIVATSPITNYYHVCSKYDQLPQNYHFKTKKEALEICDDLNKQANKELNENPFITLTTYKDFNSNVDKFITNY